MKVVILFALLAVAAADFEVVKIDPCGPPTSDAPICEINEVRINPCKKNKRCILKKGEPAAISFDFTPNFAASTLKTMVYWPDPTGGKDLAFEGLGGDNGCDYTPCPLEPGKKQTFNYDLTLGSKLPSGIFVIKWKVWNTENADNDVCCFKTTIQLKKASAK